VVVRTGSRLPGPRWNWSTDSVASLPLLVIS